MKGLWIIINLVYVLWNTNTCECVRNISAIFRRNRCILHVIKRLFQLPEACILVHSKPIFNIMAKTSKNKGPRIPGRLRKKMLRSRENGNRAFVTFVNTTHRMADVIWVNFQGSLQSYTSPKGLSPTKRIDLRTYEEHPWIFRWVRLMSCRFDQLETFVGAAFWYKLMVVYSSAVGYQKLLLASDVGKIP